MSFSYLNYYRKQEKKISFLKHYYIELNKENHCMNVSIIFSYVI